MSAEASTPQPEVPRRHLRVVKSNRSQIVLFSVLTLILSAATVWGGRTWVRNSETLVFAVGEASSLEARFGRPAGLGAGRTIPRGCSSRSCPTATAPRRWRSSTARRPTCDSAHRREKSRARPHRAHPRSRRAAAAQPRRQKIKTIADLKKKKIAVLAERKAV